MRGQPFQQAPDLGRTVTEHRCRQYGEALRVVLQERGLLESLYSYLLRRASPTNNDPSRKMW